MNDSIMSKKSTMDEFYIFRQDVFELQEKKIEEIHFFYACTVFFLCFYSMYHWNLDPKTCENENIYVPNVLQIFKHIKIRVLQ